MRVLLVGADFEENLGIGMLAAVARDRGHDVAVEPFNVPEQMRDLARSIARRAPDVVGLAIQFQHRAHDFLSLARAARAAGYRGHITCGGQFPTLAFAEVLAAGDVDTVVLHDGELTFGELLDALESKRPLAGVAGLAMRKDGAVARTAPRPLLDDLDVLPFPVRYRPHAIHGGVPFIPIVGSRGCWGRCTYCAITSNYRDARASGGGRTFRMRSAENVAEEMALLARRAGGPCIFCFHDDNLLLPREEDTLERLRAIRRHLDARGVAKIGIVGKCRPETVSSSLAPKLRELGVIRLYVGVENASESGARHLGRGKQHLSIDLALRACRENGIFTCYNLLVFEPDATLEDVEQNLAFMRKNADHPVNFCRAEPYVGTPLMQTLLARGGLGGSYLGYDYRIRDDRTELLFRIAAAVFRERNFRPDGVANRYMGLGYNLKVVEHFYEEDGERARIARRVRELTRAITLDTARFLERAIDLAKNAELGDRDGIERATARLGLEIAASDAGWHRELDAAYAAFDAYSRAVSRRIGVPPGMARTATRIAMGASLAVAACGTKTTTVDPVPSDAGYDTDGMVVDPAPYDGGVVDPLPYDAGKDARVDGGVVDPLPADGGTDVQVVDPPPPDAGVDASDGSRDARLDPRRLRLIDQWRDTSPRRARRSDDLPFSEPPDVRLTARLDGDAIVARVEGGPSAVGFRWEGEGTVEGDGREVRWTPKSVEDDALRVAVRSRGGVAVVSLRARAVRG